MKASFTYIAAKKPDTALIEQVPGVIRNKELKRTIYDKWIRVSLEGSFI